MTDPKKLNSHDGGGEYVGGMSRAAKKRAAKKNQQQQQIQLQTEATSTSAMTKKNTNSNKNDSDNNSNNSSKKKRLLDRNEGKQEKKDYVDDDDPKMETNDSLFNKKKGKKIKKDHYRNNNNEMKNYFEIEKMVMEEEKENYDDDDDEVVVMKNDATTTTEIPSSKKSKKSKIIPPFAKTTTTTSPTIHVTKKCTSLKQILLVEEEKEDENENDKTVQVIDLLNQITTSERAQCLLEYMFLPSSICLETFYTNYWEKQILYIKAVSISSKSLSQQRYRDIITTKDILVGLQQRTIQQQQQQQNSDEMDHSLYYGRDVHAVQYVYNDPMTTAATAIKKKKMNMGDIGIVPIRTIILDNGRNDFQKKDHHHNKNKNENENDEPTLVDTDDLYKWYHDPYHLQYPTKKVNDNDNKKESEVHVLELQFLNPIQFPSCHDDDDDNDELTTSSSPTKTKNRCIHSLTSLFELEFGCKVQCTTTMKKMVRSLKNQQQQEQEHVQQDYPFILSPPRYDGFEGFHIQLEGYQHYRIYKPQNKGQQLPRYGYPIHTTATTTTNTNTSHFDDPIIQEYFPKKEDDDTEDTDDNHDVNEKEKENEKSASSAPVLDTIIGPDDVIYIPRGFLYQTCPVPDPNTDKTETIKHDTDSSPSSITSFHLTIQTMEHWNWIDLFDTLVPAALVATTNSTSSISLRQSLPRNFINYMGTIHDNYREENQSQPIQQLQQKLKKQQQKQKSKMNENDIDNDNDTEIEMEEDEDDENDQMEQIRIGQIKELQSQFRTEVTKRFMRMTIAAIDMIDMACDQLAIRFLAERIPPAYSKNEWSLTKDALTLSQSGGGGRNNHRNHRPNPSTTILPNTFCRIVRPGIARLVLEDDDNDDDNNDNKDIHGTLRIQPRQPKKAIVYHCNDNVLLPTPDGTMKPLEPLEFELDDAPAIEQLLTTIEPYWILVNDLYHDSIEDKMGVAQSLFDEGILAIQQL